MKNTFSKIMSVEKGETSGPDAVGTFHTKFSFIVRGATAALIEQTEKGSFYGFDEHNKNDVMAYMETKGAISAWMNDNAPDWTACNIESAKAVPSVGCCRAVVTIIADHITPEI